MQCHHHPERETADFCRDCGEPICAGCSAEAGLCRDCFASREVPPVRQEPPRRSWRNLSIFAKFLAVLVLVMGCVPMVWMDPLGGFTHVLGWVGIAAGILMIMAKPAGWWLGLFWSLAQVVQVVVDHQVLNEPLFYLGARFAVNGSGLGFNLVGVTLVILFIVARRQFLKQEEAE